MIPVDQSTAIIITSIIAILFGTVGTMIGLYLFIQELIHPNITKVNVNNNKEV